MVAYNFQSQFEQKILAGEKTSTIRLPRKNGHALPGHALQLYVGMRTKSCRKVMDAVCTRIQYLTVNEKKEFLLFDSSNGPSPRLLDVEPLAKIEGFDSADQMLQWFSDPRYQGVVLTQILWMPKP